MTAAYWFKLASGTLALLALICGIVAGRRSHQAANVPVDPGWSMPGRLGPAMPGIPELQQMAWTAATLEAMGKSGAYNRAAVWWTVRAVILGTAASIVSLFPLSN